MPCFYTDWSHRRKGFLSALFTFGHTHTRTCRTCLEVVSTCRTCLEVVSTCRTCLEVVSTCRTCLEVVSTTVLNISHSQTSYTTPTCHPTPWFSPPPPPAHPLNCICQSSPSTCPLLSTLSLVACLFVEKRKVQSIGSVLEHPYGHTVSPPLPHSLLPLAHLWHFGLFFLIFPRYETWNHMGYIRILRILTMPYRTCARVNETRRIISPARFHWLYTRNFEMCHRNKWPWPSGPDSQCV